MAGKAPGEIVSDSICFLTLSTWELLPGKGERLPGSD